MGASLTAGAPAPLLRTSVAESPGRSNRLRWQAVSEADRDAPERASQARGSSRDPTWPQPPRGPGTRRRPRRARKFGPRRLEFDRFEYPRCSLLGVPESPRRPPRRPELQSALQERVIAGSRRLRLWRDFCACLLEQGASYWSRFGNDDRGCLRVSNDFDNLLRLLGLPFTRGNHFTRDFPRRVLDRWLAGLGCKVIKGVFRIRSGQLRQGRRGGHLRREICVRLNQDLWARLSHSTAPPSMATRSAHRSVQSGRFAVPDLQETWLKRPWLGSQDQMLVRAFLRRSPGRPKTRAPFRGAWRGPHASRARARRGPHRPDRRGSLRSADRFRPRDQTDAVRSEARRRSPPARTRRRTCSRAVRRFVRAGCTVGARARAGPSARAHRPRRSPWPELRPASQKCREGAGRRALPQLPLAKSIAEASWVMKGSAFSMVAGA